MNPKELAEIRARWGLTQAEVAKLFEVSGPLIISQWENGFRNPSGIVKKIYLLLDTLPKQEAQKLLDWLKSVHLPDVERRRVFERKSHAILKKRQTKGRERKE